jgi:hypothetical protein
MELVSTRRASLPTSQQIYDILAIAKHDGLAFPFFLWLKE